MAKSVMNLDVSEAITIMVWAYRKGLSDAATNVTRFNENLNDDELAKSFLQIMKDTSIDKDKLS